eukprot:TRINITY_DN114803_c0_g1_i1.p1 TRINITY_DN114803_c0_g1~~TRINITY_DN114803_c0_g1_i1.p1  ORF type:complete len:281 (-),score=46.00 TRINITY_DN114803_c0_g1_i1:169-1011(-)
MLASLRRPGRLFGRICCSRHPWPLLGRGHLVTPKSVQIDALPTVAIRLCATLPQDADVAIYLIAVYIQDQINGTFHDIFDKLFKLVDLLEYPNNGSMTKVTLPDAKVMIEEVGACPSDLEEFLEKDSIAEKSLGLVENSMHEASYAKHQRHPRYAHPDVESKDRSEDVPTEDLLARARREAIGIWVSKGFNKGYTVKARDGSTTHLSFKFMQTRPVDSEFNVWFSTHMREGWKPCEGTCAGEGSFKWYNVCEEDPPMIDRELQRWGCIGFCRKARRMQAK